MAEPTIEERLAALEETVAALVAQDADDYSLRYSGEEVDQALDYTLALTEEPTDVNTVVGRDKAVKPAWTAAKMNEVLTNAEGLHGYALINGASDRTYSLCIVKQSVTISANVFPDSTVTNSFRYENIIPDGMVRDGYVVIINSDGGGVYSGGWTVKDFSYTVSGRHIDVLARFYNSDSSVKRADVKVDCIVIGLRDGEGVIQL
ncbi:MAG: hypothetical protein J6M17_10395 [Ruminococcus sp.]|nr:hypothetical protein [Ruminococcus sp.]